MTDAVPSSLLACIIFSTWLRQTGGRTVSFVVHVVSVRIRRITLPQKPFTSTCLRTVSCPAIIVGPSTEKEGLRWKTMKKRRMMTTILCSLRNAVILLCKTLKKKEVNIGHQMSPLMVLVGSFLMQSENAIQKRRS